MYLILFIRPSAWEDGPGYPILGLVLRFLDALVYVWIGCEFSDTVFLTCFRGVVQHGRVREGGGEGGDRGSTACESCALLSVECQMVILLFVTDAIFRWVSDGVYGT